MTGNRKAAGGTAAIQNTDPNPAKGPVEVIIELRVGTGNSRQASPVPSTTHIPKLKVRGVCA